MARKVLVSLVSDQTIPNVELIKEFQEGVDRYVFITTKQMQKQFEWIISASKINNPENVEIDPFDPIDIESKLNSCDFGDEEIILNITGGTKLSSLIVNDYFRSIGATIYYITGHEKKYIKIFPNRGKREFILEKEITLNEYLCSYGFSYKDTIPCKDFVQSQKIFDYFIQNLSIDLKNSIESIRLRRDKNMELSSFHKVVEFLQAIGYQYENNCLSKKDTKYLSGDWLEEYVFYMIKKELSLNDDEIATGINLVKENNPNEIDVIFIHKNKLHIVECKTSLIDRRKVTVVRDGVEKEEEKDFKILGETIYKSDALSKKFGLFANTSILTLEEIKELNGSPLTEYKTLFDRANLSRVQIISKRDLISGKTFKELLKIS